MATPTAPYVAQNVEDVVWMIKGLEEGLTNKSKAKLSVKKTTFAVKGSSAGIMVDSWRMHEWDYKRRDLPTYARGLFTTKNSRKQPEIVVRGYDKFFNVGEVHETKWENILTRTQGPYELTLKENGCIIFISGLEDDTLLVCSKHSTGDRSDVTVSHASAGQVRLEQQLAAVGRTKADLARELRQKNITAVAELCDDSFEEHILAYGPDEAGLYLHGINLNLPEFATYPSPAVQEFSERWGFRKTGLTVMDDILKVKEFLEEAAETGAYNGRDVEGFVIRCQRKGHPTGSDYGDWFFKFKFEEPYLMYRQWRECTKALISGKQPKYKKHQKITEEYLLYARGRLASDPELGRLYKQNHGIIALRDDFLNFKNLKGADAANMDVEAETQELKAAPMTEVTKDVVLCPIATIGCGKTTIALALEHLFGWGHIQNDNISGKGRPPRFTKAVLGELVNHPAVFADRNNASRHERKQLIGDLKLQHLSLKIVCLNFVHNEAAIDDIRRVTQGRVMDRGDNHQTIHAATDRDKFLGVMESFINRFEPCNPHHKPDDGFDIVIDLDPTQESRQNLEKLVRDLHHYFPNFVAEIPSPERLDAAIEAALGYRPGLKHNIPDRGKKDQEAPGKQQEASKKKKKRPLEYMSVVVPAQDITNSLNQAFNQTSPDTSRLYMQLKQTGRVQSKFHVTLIHRASAKDHPQLWERYSSLQRDAEEAGNPEAKLGDCGVVMERVSGFNVWFTNANSLLIM